MGISAMMIERAKGRRTMITASRTPRLIELKLAAFEHLQPEFEACFQFVQEVHGQKRFVAFPVTDTVRYLHALWVCERKTYLLSVAKTVKVYEGERCLELLRHWQQENDTAQVVEFLNRKLDMLPLADITRQIHEAEHTHNGLLQRLRHGRMILLNRGFNLLQTLDAIFTMPEEEMAKLVHEACQKFGHLPEQITQQLQAMASPLYSFAPHQILAQRNMQVMNKLGVNATMKPADLPGQRSWRVVEPTGPLQPFAEHIVQGYQELVSPIHNNILGERFVDRPEQSGSESV